jgi:hypothetical protein
MLDQVVRPSTRKAIVDALEISGVVGAGKRATKVALIRKDLKSESG